MCSLSENFFDQNMLMRALIVLLATASWIQAADYLCTDDFCSYYLEKNECMSTSTACYIQNKTHSGELYPGEVPCGCCKVCLQNLNEGDPCTTGSPDVTPPMLVCGPGLYCMRNETSLELTCQKMRHTQCFKEQIEFDKKQAAGELGSFQSRPRCDGDGNFVSIKCTKGQTCFCINRNGKRIFGEAPYSKINELTMKCECSRMYDTFMNVMTFEYPTLTARCQENGSFDPLQCMDEKCVCVEPELGSPWSDVAMITNGNHNRMPCFDRKLHLDYKYAHDCEEMLTNVVEEIEEAKSQRFTILGYKVPKCQPDGWFQAIQSDETKFFCVDKYNRRIEDFEAERGTDAAKDMNCKCARTRLLLRKYKAKYLPECTPNGNFEKIQCRNDWCYCVDEDGLQLSKEVPKSSNLTCST